MKVFSLGIAVAAIFVAVNCHAQDNIWTGAGGDTKWENGANWQSGSPPTDPNLAVDDNGGVVRIDGDVDVLFDADTWQYIIDNNQLNTAGPAISVDGVDLSTAHWGNGQLLMGENATVTGTSTFTFDHGGDNPVNIPAVGSTIIGQRAGDNCTLNVMSGRLTVGGGQNNGVSLGISEGSSGTINLTGGTLALSRATLLIAADANGSRDGEGTVNISGGAFRNRTNVIVGANGTFNVQGSEPTQIGIGSFANGDGEWTQRAGGRLRTGLDAGGITPIFIDDFEDDGNGNQGNVTFEAGAILDPYDAGGGTNELTTVMTWEGSLNNEGLVLSDEAIAAGWVMQIVGNELQVQNPNLGGIVHGDVDLSGQVNFLDIAPFIAALTSNTFQAQADCDENGVVDFRDIAPFIAALAGA